jgi:hypothetical protein
MNQSDVVEWIVDYAQDFIPKAIRFALEIKHRFVA